LLFSIPEADMIRTAIAHWSIVLALTVPQLQRTAPTISSIDPSEPATSTTQQTLVVRGAEFTTGLSVTVTDPATHTQTYSGPAIAKQTATSFELTVTLRVAGDYSMVVTLNDRSVSNSFGFKVKSGRSPVQGNTPWKLICPFGLMDSRWVARSGFNVSDSVFLVLSRCTCRTADVRRERDRVATGGCRTSVNQFPTYVEDARRKIFGRPASNLH
jgi:hypothetical protein